MVCLRGWMLAAVAVAMTGCPDAGQDDGSGDSAAESGETGDSGGTADTGATDDGLDTGDTDDCTTPPSDVEEEHVVLLDDCGLELSCDPITIHIESWPSDAVACARGRHADGEPSLLEYGYLPGGGPEYFNFEEAFLTMPDRRVIRQSRGRMQTDDPPQCRPWGAWGPHEVCDVVHYFTPDGNVQNCEEVPDFSCEELIEIFESDPLPPVPCAERTDPDTCHVPFASDSSCGWREELATYSGDSCEPVLGPGACVEDNAVDEPDCTLPEVCDGAEAEQILYRDNGDETFDIMYGYGCWQYEGFERCEWAAGELFNGPPACNCACGA